MEAIGHQGALPPSPLVTSQEVAALLRIGRTKLREMRRDPGFPSPVRVSQRPLLWRRADIERYLDASC